MRSLAVASILVLCGATPAWSQHEVKSAPPDRFARMREACDLGGADPAVMRPIAIKMSTDMVRDVQNIPRALRAAGFRLEDAPFLVWRTNVVTKWPRTANEELREHPHPGVAAELVVGKSGDTTVVLGTVVPVCASPAGVPDSVGRIAAELAGQRILDELEKRR